MPGPAAALRLLEEIRQNVYAHELAKTAEALKDFKKTTAYNQQPIDLGKHKLFPMPLSIFTDFPVNSTFV